MIAACCENCVLIFSLYSLRLDAGTMNVIILHMYMEVGTELVLLVTDNIDSSVCL